VRFPTARNGGWQLTGAALTFVLAVLTIVMPNWIEQVLGVDPDGGDGLLEVAIVAVCALATVVLGSIGVVKYRRATT
jgi:hypothetical protein